MELSRRDFLKASGAGIGGVILLGAFSDGVALASPIKHIPLKKKTRETTTICCYCAVGCGAIVSSYGDGTIKIEGDPDGGWPPINQAKEGEKYLPFIMKPEGVARTWAMAVPRGRYRRSTSLGRVR